MRLGPKVKIIVSQKDRFINTLFVKIFLIILQFKQRSLDTKMFWISMLDRSAKSNIHRIKISLTIELIRNDRAFVREFVYILIKPRKLLPTNPY